MRTEAMQQISDICKNLASLDNKSKFIWLLSNENIIIIDIVIKLLMSLTETRTKLLSGSEVCPPGSLPSSHCIITSWYNIYYAFFTYKYLPIKLYA
jgi:hypothetical protein